MFLDSAPSAYEIISFWIVLQNFPFSNIYDAQLKSIFAKKILKILYKPHFIFNNI